MALGAVLVPSFPTYIMMWSKDFIDHMDFN